jgi:hypothetical protein
MSQEPLPKAAKEAPKLSEKVEGWDGNGSDEEHKEDDKALNTGKEREK